ncbi:hypothetical protein DV451_003932 [Geotrichum candidum]|uniref:Uncharacterized protein n=1 Tax=Geotrichum candidum TaxID=1173061 RepID=A0A9P5G3F2_GEOCN|nr:hypothetical protein DV451_003932 [Geotrichum candidum]KAF5108610.1 hypothetical protein DV453_002203 [Geotrichum candidum]
MATLSKAEAELTVHIKKATNPEETAPKRKHVRQCIIYTWDNHSGRAFWNGMKIQPLQNDEVQVFKALITIHKVLQEGHPSVLREAQQNRSWLESLARGAHAGRHTYAKLIYEYVGLLLKKLNFHKNHPDFNGTFEYEEYISLRNIDDPNEGYQAIVDLMDLQDAIDNFQRLIIASLKHGRPNECRISALIPLVAESYGIYRFTTTMLRAMHATTNDDDALEPLRSRYYSQHQRLLEFYYDCSSLKYLISVITIPTLSQDPPNLYGENPEEGEAPALPKRPISEVASLATGATTAPSTTDLTPEPVVDFWSTPQGQQQLQQQQLQQQQYEEEQRRLAAQREAELQQQQMLHLQQQQQFEEQQRMQAEQQRLAQEALLRDQYQRQADGRAAELERDILNLRGQYERDQLMLEQYDRRVKGLEGELQQVIANTNLQSQSKDDMIRSLQEQVNSLKSKYDVLAKLYSQLRQEHLDKLKELKLFKVKAASAQEAIEKREKLERDIKAKNIELADLIRERDRARYDLDKSRGNQKDVIEKLERQLRLTEDKLADAERSKGADLSLLISKHNRELADLEEALKAKQSVLDNYANRSFDDSDLKLKLAEKDDELEILQETVDSMEAALKEMSLNHNEADQALEEQIDEVLKEHLSKLNSIIDSVLESSAERVQESLFEFESPMQAGNQNSTPEYLLSIVEKASTSATDFATSFNNFIIDGPNGDYSGIISTATILSSVIPDVLNNAKGLTRLARDDTVADNIISYARLAAVAVEDFFSGVQSNKLAQLSDEDKTDKVINFNIDVQTHLQSLSQVSEKLTPRAGTHLNGSGDLGDLVDREMARAAEAIESANAKLNELLSRPKDPKFSVFDLKIHEAILAAAIAVTTAIAALIKAASDCQQEIVAQGKGASSRTAFYKKHNRWTEGLISAAKSVAASTNVLIETADGVLSGNHTPEQLIVASNEVASSTAQLVAASRVKASYMSKTQDRLEGASKAVTSACRSLVNQVQDILSKKQQKEENDVDYSKLTPHVLKTTEMEQQVEILKLENSLNSARKRLGEIRKYSYVDDEDEE